MKAITDDNCCGKQEDMKRMIDNILKEVSNLTCKVREIENLVKGLERK